MAKNNIVKVGGELKSIAADSVVAAAEAIFDYTKNKNQEVINRELLASVAERVKNLAGSASDEQTVVKAGNDDSNPAYVTVKKKDVEIHGRAGNVTVDDDGINITAGNSGFPNATVKINGQSVATQQYVSQTTAGLYENMRVEDDEDLTMLVADNGRKELKLADKVYAPEVFSGLGRKYLRKNYSVQNAIPFNGFVEDVTVETAGTVLTPTAIFFDTVNKWFVGQVGLKYYNAWQGNGDYEPVSETKTYVYNGKGYTWDGEELVEGAAVSNVLTQQMVSQANTIYVIQYDYDLNGQAITLPAGCVLEFDGGSVKNGTLAGNGTIINAGVNRIFSSVTFSGTWANKEAYPEWFGEYGLWTDSENLFIISKSVRLTGATYWSPSSNAPTLRVRGTLFSDCQSEIRIVPPSNDFIGIQLGDPNGSLQTREKRLKLKGISVFLHTLTNAQRTAVLGISYTQGLTIENCSFANSNARNSVITKSVLDAPAETLNYGIVFYGDATGSSEITAFINSSARGDIAVYFKDEADFVNFYGGSFGCGNYGYGLVYGQQVTNLGFFGVAFNQGIRQIHVVTENPQKDATSGMTLENCRFEQLYNGTIEDDVDGGDAFYASCVLTFELSSTNSSYTYGLYSANTLSPLGTKLRIKNNRLSVVAFVNCWCLSIDTHSPVDVSESEYINLTFVNTFFRADNVSITTNSAQIVENLTVSQVSASVVRYGMSNLRIVRNSSGDRRTSGTNALRPIIQTGEEKGFQYYSQSLSRPTWWNGSAWKDQDGYTFALKIGNSTQRPSTLTSGDVGFYFWDMTLKKPLFLKATGASEPKMRWADGLGRRIDTEVYGTTRPTGLGAANAGQMFFDTSLGKPIFWNGTGWVDATGTDV